MSALGHSAPSAADFLDAAEACLAALPEAFRPGAVFVRVVVEDIADDDVLDELGIEDPLELTGLYSGTPLTEAGGDTGETRLIQLFRLPILLEWAQSEDITLRELIQHVLIHELGHHFGWSDDDMDGVLARMD